MRVRVNLCIITRGNTLLVMLGEVDEDMDYFTSVVGASGEEQRRSIVYQEEP